MVVARNTRVATSPLSVREKEQGDASRSGPSLLVGADLDSKRGREEVGGNRTMELARGNAETFATQQRNKCNSDRRRRSMTRWGSGRQVGDRDGSRQMQRRLATTT